MSVMTSKDRQYLDQIRDYVSERLLTVDSGHDFSHVQRVLANAIQINVTEKGDSFLVEAGALLHDITDEKLFDKKKAEEDLVEFLGCIGLDSCRINEIIVIINRVSFGAEFGQRVSLSVEQKVVRDADRLDAMGAIGIARAFHYGGSRNREIFNSDIPPVQYSSTTEYRNSTAPTINHFYEKLLLLKDRMETPTGQKLAEQRHQFMLTYLKHFFNEIGFDGDWSLDV
jgi:uncharacterized protein